MSLLNLKNDFFEDIYQNSPDMIILGDVKTEKIVDCNKTFLKRTGYKIREVLSMQNFREIYHPDCYDILKSCREHTLKTGVYNNVIVALKAKNGEKIPVALSACPFNDKNWGKNLIKVYIREITALQEAQEKIEKQNRELDTKNEDLKSLIYVLSHDLKSSLRGINNLSHILLTEGLNNLSDVSSQYINKIKDQSYQAYKLVENSIRYFMYKDISFSFEKLELADLLEEINALLLLPSEVQIILKSELKYIYSSKLALKQSLYNLINNAINHHHNLSTAKIIINVEETDTLYRIKVSDNGPGIKEEYLERIFEPFYSPKVGKRSNASGLGLAIVKQLINDLKGNITVDSKLGIGTTFTIEFPKQQL